MCPTLPERCSKLILSGWRPTAATHTHAHMTAVSPFVSVHTTESAQQALQEVPPCSLSLLSQEAKQHAGRCVQQLPAALDKKVCTPAMLCVHTGLLVHPELRLPHVMCHTLPIQKPPQTTTPQHDGCATQHTCSNTTPTATHTATPAAGAASLLRCWHHPHRRSRRARDSATSGNCAIQITLGTHTCRSSSQEPKHIHTYRQTDR